MRRFRRQRILVRRIASLLIIPLVLSGTSYALFSQNLSIAGTSSKPSYSATQYTLMTYTKTVTQQGPVWLYSLSMTVKNRGVTQLTAWQVKFDVPADTAALTCQSVVTCSRAGNTVTIVNGVGNGTLNAGASTVFTLSFTTSINPYTLQNVLVSGTYSTAWQTIAGLTASFTRGARTKSGQWYRWTYTFTVTNNSGQNLSAWRIVGTPWATASNRVGVMDATVTYISGATSLTITSTTAINNTGVFTFTGRLESTNLNWNLTAIPIQGRP